MKTVKTVIIKTTHSCNLSCQYCYATDRSGNTNQNLISPKIVEELISKSILSAQDDLEFIWHGGEPLLLGIEFFKNIIEIEHKLNSHNIRITNSIQTNATLITSEWADFFQDNQITPGVSLDGPKVIHDSMRKKNFHGSFALAMQGIKNLQKNNITPNILAVVSKNSLGHEKEILQFFTENKLNIIDFLPYAEFTNNVIEPYSLTPLDFGNFMINVFNLWMERDDPKIEIRFLRNALFGILGGQINLCTMTGTCTDFFGIDTNGDVYHCDWFIGNKQHCFGNISRESFSEICKKAKYKQYVKVITGKKSECTNCSWKHICGGGCSHHREILGGFSKPYYFCESRKMIFDHINTHLEKLESM